LLPRHSDENKERQQIQGLRPLRLIVRTQHLPATNRPEEKPRSGTPVGFNDPEQRTTPPSPRDPSPMGLDGDTIIRNHFTYLVIGSSITSEVISTLDPTDGTAVVKNFMEGNTKGTVFAGVMMLPNMFGINKAAPPRLGTRAATQCGNSSLKRNEISRQDWTTLLLASTLGRFTGPDEFTGGPEQLFYSEQAAKKNPTRSCYLIQPSKYSSVPQSR